MSTLKKNLVSEVEEYDMLYHSGWERLQCFI